MRVETSISSSYADSWGVAEGIREVIQNAIDGDMKNNRMDIAYSRRTQTLTVANRGVVLPRKFMLLGSSTKKNDDTQIGQHGDGGKVGALALVRAGKKVKLINGKEEWIASIQRSEQFEEDVLVFDTKELIFASKDLKVVIEGITAEEWSVISQNFLHIVSPDQKTIVPTPDGSILRDQNYKGKIFCGGIYVTTKSDLKYGYNFKPSIIKLNRDRNMIHDFDLHWATSKMWACVASVKKTKVIDTYDMLKSGVPDVKYIKSFADYKFSDEVVEQFYKENSPASYPVENESEARRVRSYGYTPVYSSPSYAEVLRGRIGTIDDLARKIDLTYSAFQSITPIDDANLQWVYELMFQLDSKFYFDISLVVFETEMTKSSREMRDKQTHKILINSKLLINKYLILKEVARHYADITNQPQEDVWCDIYRATVENLGMNQEPLLYKAR